MLLKWIHLKIPLTKYLTLQSLTQRKCSLHLLTFQCRPRIHSAKRGLVILEVKDLGGKHIYMVKSETKYFSYFWKRFAYNRNSWNKFYLKYSVHLFMTYLLMWFMGMCVMKIQSREMNLIHVSSSQKRPYTWPSFCEWASLNLCSIKAHVLKMLGDTFERHFGVSEVGHHFRIISSVQSLSHVQTLRPHESQHPRPPCPSPTPGVHSDSHPLSQWCHPAISSSPSPPAPKPSQHQSLF